MAGKSETFKAAFRAEVEAKLQAAIQEKLAKAVGKEEDSKEEALLGEEQKEGVKGIAHETFYMEKVAELQELVEDKSELEYKHDCFSLTGLSFLKRNGELPSAGSTPLDEDASAFGLKREKLA